jgi:lactate dehydrogenase-like 2-hydroxyacid dehydrogenase
MEDAIFPRVLRVSDFELLMPACLTDFLADGLSKTFTLHKLWEAADKDAKINEVKDRVRCLISGGIGRFKVNADFIARFPNLELIAHMGVGYDLIDAHYAAVHGVMVTNTPDVLNEDTADIAMALLLDTTRQIPQCDAFLRAGKWLEGTFPLTATLRGRTMGILGYGRIGKAIARRAEAFGLKIIYHGRTKQEGVAYSYYESPVALASACDILMVVAPGGPQTRHIVNKDVLQALGPDGILVNIARGSLVDEEALIHALKTRVILGAGLDVFEAEPKVPQALIELQNTVLLPHMGSATHYTRQAMAQLVIDNVISWTSGGGPLTPVAETPWPCPK